VRAPLGAPPLPNPAGWVKLNQIKGVYIIFPYEPAPERGDMTALSTLLSIVPRIGYSENDTSEIRMEKAILVSASLALVVITLFYGSIYLFYQEVAASLVSYSFSVITLICLAFMSRTGRHREILIVLFLLGLVLPFAHTLILGGLWNSSVVIIWSLMIPIGSLLYYQRKYVLGWWAAYFILLVSSALLQPLVEQENNLPAGLIQTLFILNIGSLSGIILVLLSFFIHKKDEAYHLLRIEEEKAENLLLNILPPEIAAILKDGEKTIADHFDGASILFADLVGFTPLTKHLEPVKVVNLLNEIFSHFDSLVEKYGVEKIRTIGDNYMVAAGVPRPQPDHARRLAQMGLEMQAYIQKKWSNGNPPIDFRMGINSGPVIGGVIGRKKFVYDIWGDAVNIASRMESQGVAGQIQVTRATYELICDEFLCEPRGVIEIKGRGEMDTYFLVGRKSEHE
jgi:adenylate cyclase